jgi:hypothetical protein
MYREDVKCRDAAQKFLRLPVSRASRSTSDHLLLAYPMKILLEVQTFITANLVCIFWRQNHDLVVIRPHSESLVGLLSVSDESSRHEALIRSPW